MSADGHPASGSMPNVPAARSLVGEVLDGRYKILKKLGEGGMGEVYAAEHVHIEKRFAIKLLRPEIVSNAEAVSRFRQEARSSSSIGHRNIIAIEDFGQLSDGRIYMCMELLNGAALNDLILQPQPVDRLLNILIQTGHGLAAAHAKNIVHRDMKPENIFVTWGTDNVDVPKILDFGIAKVAGNEGQNNLTRTGTIFGTPFYMAPEQALGNPVDARTDIYAMGVIMYEVFAGSLPFRGESFMGILTQHITTDPEPVEQRAAAAARPLPPGLADIIACCMRKDPAQRFASMAELVAALVQIYRSTAGAGMSTYMEAFPVAHSAQHPVSTPTGQLGAGKSPTVGVGAPPGASGSPPYGAPSGGPQPYGPPSGGHQAGYPPPYYPSGTGPALSSQSGLYDAAGSAVVPPPKSKAGLIVAILAVLAVGGGIGAFVIVGQGSDTGAGSGSQVADVGSAGSGGIGAAPTTGSGSAVVNGGDTGSGATVPDTGSAAPDTGAAGSAGLAAPDTGAAGSGAPDTGSAAPDTGSAAVAPTIDAGVIATAPVKVLLSASNTGKFEIWEGGKKLFSGPKNIEVAPGSTRTLVLKARGFKDTTVVVDPAKGEGEEMAFALDRLPPKTQTTSATTPPPSDVKPPRCTNTTADIKDKTSPCHDWFCDRHPEHKDNCQLE